VVHPLRIGAAIPPYGPTYDDVRRAALAAEAAGADSLWTWDHFFQSGAREDVAGPNLECMTVLAALAVATRRASLGALVACNSYRNADLHADMARTIDHASDGRFVLGIGAGWFEPDYVEYGYPFGSARDRVEALAAALPRLRSRLGRLVPGPLRGHLPLLIAGGGERLLLRLVAEHADLWNCYGTPAELAHKSAILDEHCAEIGRDPAEIERTVLLEEDEAELAAEYHEAGMTHLIVTLSAPRYDMAQVDRLCAWRDRVAV
jgi:probable F420-dependent oxidoreductase